MSSDWGGGGSADGFSQPTYHQLQGDTPPHELPPTRSLPADGGGAGDHPAGRDRPPRPASVRPEGTGDVTVTRALVLRSRYLSKLLAHKVISASQADGARESGLTAMIWNQVMSYASDAMVTVALAGTVFFSAPTTQQRGNVLLYLLMTMAPFAIVAPVIGPALDRVQHGRRLVMAATAIGRSILALVMAANFHDLYVLFPAALGSLVLSKAYAVIRASATPRLVPARMTLVEANGRLSIFGLCAAILGGGVVGAAIKATGSYPLGLWITAFSFAATAYSAFRLPRIVDALPWDTIAKINRPTGTEPLPESPQPASSAGQSLLRRFASWARRGFTEHAVLALQGGATLRWLAGLLTLFLAFYVESTSHGWQAVVNLGAMGAANGAGNFLGNGIGSRLKLLRPDLIILVCNSAAGVACLLTALFFSLPMAILTILISALSYSLAKLSLDAIIQRDTPESLRSSAFGRSETYLQLAWVFGATIAILIPAKSGQLGFIMAACVTVAVAIFMALRERALSAAHHTRPGRRSEQPHPGNLGP